MAGMTPMRITLYDPVSQEARAEFSQVFVPWKLLKAAVRLSKSLDLENLGEEDVDAIAALVVETFGNRFSIEDLNQGADVGEMIAVMTAIVSRAQGVAPAGNFQK